MSHITLACTECKHRHEADMLTLHCDRCGYPLDVEYKDANRHSIEWHGFTMPVPFHSDTPAATMGEGHTPIVPMTRVSENLGHSKIFGKLELMNPTGSFKDRGAAAMLSVAVEQGVREVVEDSSGNAGAAIAAYAARVGIKANIFAPSNAPKAKMTQIQVYGAATHPVPGPREASTEAALQFQREHGTVYASHNLSPYFLEGTKTFAYEVAAQMDRWPRPHNNTGRKRKSLDRRMEGLQRASEHGRRQQDTEASCDSGGSGQAHSGPVRWRAMDGGRLDRRGRHIGRSATSKVSGDQGDL